MASTRRHRDVQVIEASELALVVPVGQNDQAGISPAEWERDRGRGAAGSQMS